MNKTILGLSLTLNVILWRALKIANDRNHTFRRQIIATDKRNDQLNDRGETNAH